VAAMWDQAKRNPERRAKALDLLREEYQLHWLAHTFTKPLAVVGHGLTAGSGAALMQNAKFAYSTDSTKLLFPEVSAGLTLTGGNSYHLGRVRGGMGMYAALTSLPVDSDMAYWGGLTAYRTSDRFTDEDLLRAAGERSNVPLLHHQVEADSVYQAELERMRKRHPSEKYHYYNDRMPEDADAGETERYLQLNAWYRMVKVGRPDIASLMATG